MRSSHWITRALLLIFILAIVVWWVYSQLLYPEPVHLAADPQIPYMLSSLSPFKGEPYTFIDHPGTPIELLGTLLLALSFPFTREPGMSFTMAHISNPGIFLLLTRSLLVALSMLTLAVFTARIVRVEHWTDELAAISLALLFFAIYPVAFEQLVTWSHNSFAYPLGGLLGVGVIVLLRDHAGGSLRQRMVLGALLGIFAAVQVYFITWLLGAMLAALVYVIMKDGGWRAALITSAQLGFAGLGGFVLITLPIADQYGEFVRWIITVSSHQGRHGSGAPGFINMSTALSNLVVLISQAKVLFIAFVITLALLSLALFRRGFTRRSQPALWACAVGFLAQLTVMLALVIKHPGILYLQAVAVSLVLLLGVTIGLLGAGTQPGQKIRRMGLFAMSVIILTLFAFNFLRAIGFHHAEREHVQAAEQEIARFIQARQGPRADEGGELVKLWVYGTPSECHALWYGNRYAHLTFSTEIGSICRQDLTYDMWERQVTLPNGAVVPLSEVSWDVLIAYEAALVEFPHLGETGEVIFSEVSLGPFGRIVYILNS